MYLNIGWETNKNIINNWNVSINNTLRYWLMIHYKWLTIYCTFVNAIGITRLKTVIVIIKLIKLKNLHFLFVLIYIDLIMLTITLCLLTKQLNKTLVYISDLTLIILNIERVWTIGVPSWVHTTCNYTRYTILLILVVEWSMDKVLI